MLGLLFVYFLGKYFYDLAGQYDRHQWGMAILGVISYYVGSFIGAAAIAAYMEIWGGGAEILSDSTYGFIGIPFGLLLSFILYKILESVWKEKDFDDEFEYEDRIEKIEK